MTLQTRRARPTRARDPLDTHALAHLDDGAFGARAHLRDDAHAFVAANLTGLRWCGEGGPLLFVTRIQNGTEKRRKGIGMDYGTLHDAQVAVADAGVGPVGDDQQGM